MYCDLPLSKRGAKLIFTDQNSMFSLIPHTWAQRISVWLECTWYKRAEMALPESFSTWYPVLTAFLLPSKNLFSVTEFFSHLCRFSSLTHQKKRILYSRIVQTFKVIQESDFFCLNMIVTVYKLNIFSQTLASTLFVIISVE